MAKYNENGGIIGPATVPTGNFGSAPGVWKLAEVEKYIKEGIWPVATTGFQVQNSLRFDDGSSDYLSRTPASDSNRRTFTISVWVKRGILSSQDRIFDASTGATTQAGLIFMSSDGIQFYAGSGQIDISTNRVFRDNSAWYHIVVAVDTTQATSSDRVKLYVNGTQETSLATSTYPSQDYDTLFNSTVEHTWSKRWDADQFYDGYMAECVLIDGQALTPSSFGETDATTGNWVPKDVSGLTFGTNGFYLRFQNALALGQDDSGNGNNFTVNNLTSIDQCVDTCTNNFATLNPLEKESSNITFSNGNTSQTTSSTSGDFTMSTLAVSQGKWYMETKWVSGTATGSFVGFSTLRNQGTVTGYLLNLNGTLSNLTASGTAPSGFSAGDIIGVAIDLDNDRIQFYIDGVANGDYCTFTRTAGEPLLFVVGNDAHSCDTNFGNPPFSISSGNTDYSGLGNFEYEVPSGYRALCTKNIGLVG